jgi:hypothetical protein
MSWNVFAEGINDNDAMKKFERAMRAIPRDQCAAPVTIIETAGELTYAFPTGLPMRIGSIGHIGTDGTGSASISITCTKGEPV